MEFEAYSPPRDRRIIESQL